MKSYYFESGLPRTGSTLLSAILNQNPNICAEPSSPVIDAMMLNQDFFLHNEHSANCPQPHRAHKIISSIIHQYYEDKPQKIIIDKSRGWVGHIDFICNYITQKPKIIVTVRNPLEIITSFVSLIHKNSNSLSYIDRMISHGFFPVTDKQRCDFLLGPNGIVFHSLCNLKKGLDNYNEFIHLVEYDNLVNNPQMEIEKIYNFLQIDSYQHNFMNVRSKYFTLDNSFNMPGMHDVREKINKISLKPEEVISEDIINLYSGLDFWNNDGKLFEKLCQKNEEHRMNGNFLGIS